MPVVRWPKCKRILERGDLDNHGTLAGGGCPLWPQNRRSSWCAPGGTRCPAVSRRSPLPVIIVVTASPGLASATSSGNTVQGLNG